MTTNGPRLAATLVTCLVTLGLLLCPRSDGRLSAQEVTVTLVNGTTVQGRVDLPTVEVKTDYGTLTIPTTEVLVFHPGFGLTSATAQRVKTLVGRITDPRTGLAAQNELKRLGRSAVPALQSLTRGEDRAAAYGILKTIWPCSTTVDPAGRAVVVTREFVARGEMTFSALTVNAASGVTQIKHDDIEGVTFGEAEVPPVEPWTDYGETPADRPDMELELPDGSAIRGQLDHETLRIQTRYGTLEVPVRDVLHLRPGAGSDRRDELLTRQFRVFGSVEGATLRITSKLGPLDVPRDQVVSLRAMIPGLIPVQTITPGPEPLVEPGKWARILDAKNMQGWRKWGTGKMKPHPEGVLLTGESGLTFDRMPPARNVVLSAEVQILKPGITKLSVLDGETGLYYLEFTGRGGSIGRWDNAGQKATELATFTTGAASEEIYRLDLVMSGSTLMAYLNGRSVATVTLPTEDLLGPGLVSVGTWNSDTVFRLVQLKILK